MSILITWWSCWPLFVIARTKVPSSLSSTNQEPKAMSSETFISISADSDFTFENIPFGIISTTGDVSFRFWWRQCYLKYSLKNWMEIWFLAWYLNISTRHGLPSKASTSYIVHQFTPKIYSNRLTNYLVSSETCNCNWRFCCWFKSSGWCWRISILPSLVKTCNSRLFSSTHPMLPKFNHQLGISQWIHVSWKTGVERSEIYSSRSLVCGWKQLVEI